MSDIQAYLNVSGTPYVKVVLADLTGAPYVASGGGGGGADRELVCVTYVVTTAFTGASVGDVVTSTQVIDVTATPASVSVIWRNQTTAADLASPPSAANIQPVGTSGLTDAQLRASAVPVSLPAITVLTDVDSIHTGPFTIAAGAATYAVANLGATACTFNGVALAAGESLSKPPVFGRNYPAVSGDATGTTVKVSRQA